MIGEDSQRERKRVVGTRDEWAINGRGRVCVHQRVCVWADCGMGVTGGWAWRPCVQWGSKAEKGGQMGMGWWR